ncbi:hypothetical protein BJ742DRAFT_765979 [Cladochytrium replicatum]|nr:hypothetical protein BJ742DRAFT_765979 [Cladochytrium replicatum]
MEKQVFEEFVAKQQTNRSAGYWAKYARTVVLPELQRAGFLAATSDGVDHGGDNHVGKENTRPEKFGAIEDSDPPMPRSTSVVPPDSPVLQDERVNLTPRSSKLALFLH